MTEASLEHIAPDPWLARSYFLRALEFIGDGERSSLSAAGRQVLLHDAALSLCDAVLAINGRGVVGSEGGHVLRLEQTERLLGDGLHDLFERLDDGRLARGSASYRAAPIPESGPEAALEAVIELRELAQAHIEPRLPDHLSLSSG